MKYFIDTEFIEGFHKPWFEKRRHFIDLISIGIVAEDGRAYYAISKEYDYNMADQWVKENVILPMYIKCVNGDARNHLQVDTFHKYVLQSKSLKEIASDVIEFINPDLDELIEKFTRHDCWAEVFYKKEFQYIKLHNTQIPDTYYKSGYDSSGYKKNRELIYNQPEFYGYYCDYDWVVFCSLFGRMIDLPKGFPMFCIDLKQIMDEKAMTLNQGWATPLDQVTMEQRLKLMKSYRDFPVQKNEHDALADAQWNRELLSFLIKNFSSSKP